MIHYSIEWVPKLHPARPVTWNQHALTRFRWLSRVHLFEARLRYGRKANNFRIREL